MSVQIPPEYAQTHADLQHAIDNPVKLSDDALIQSLDTFSSRLQTPGAQRELEAEIEVLSRQTIDMSAAFDRITDLFVRVQTGNVTASLRQDVARLRDIWGSHRTVSMFKQHVYFL